MSELLEELHNLQIEKLRVDIEIMVEKDNNHGVPRAHKQRTLEKVLSVRAVELHLETKILRARIFAQGEPMLAHIDILNSLYAVEALFEIDNHEDAWDALSGVIDHMENEFERMELI